MQLSFSLFSTDATNKVCSAISPIYIYISFWNILTFSKAFDSTPDFENLGYHV